MARNLIDIEIVGLTGCCNGNIACNSGAATLNILNGAGPFTAQITSPYVGTAVLLVREPYTFSGLSAGTYTIFVSDSDTPINNTANINLYISSGISTSTIAVDSACGLNNGEIQISLTPNLGNENTFNLYDIDDNLLSVTQSTDNPYVISGLSPNAYYVIVEDNGGCSANTGTMVIESSYSLLSVNATVVNNSPCALRPNGEIYITLYNETPPVSINWSTNVGLQLNDYYLTGLTNATYIVEVTDGTGCVVTQEVIVGLDDRLGIGEFSFSNPSCFVNNGVVNITLTGGSLPITYYTSLGTTFTSGKVVASLNDQNKDRFCTSSGTMAPIDSAGNQNEAAIAAARSKGTVAAIKAFYDSIHKTANNNTLRNNDRKDAVKQCYGIQLNKAAVVA